MQIQLHVGSETGILVGWQKNGKVNAGSIDVKVDHLSIYLYANLVILEQGNVWFCTRLQF